MTRHIPNLLTCCNLLCGAIGIIHLFQGDVNRYPIAWFVWLAVLFDFLDGFFARLLKVQSPIGRDLDSLADMVTFGILPGIFMFQWIESQSINPLYAYTALIIVVCSALRLAIFNNDASQSTSFKGLPTPANALFLTGLPFLEVAFLSYSSVLMAISVVFSLLMVSRLELFALKFKDFSWRGNEVRFTFMMVSVLLLITVKFAAIPLLVLIYLLISVGRLVFKGNMAK